MDSDKTKVREGYKKLMLDNANYLIEQIYLKKNEEPYNNTEMRIFMSLGLIFSNENKFVSSNLSKKIAKDINDLMMDNEYLSRFNDKSKIINSMKQELTKLINMTELDDTISLNISSEDLNKLETASMMSRLSMK